MNAHLPPHILHLTILPVDSILPYPHYQVSHTPYVRDPPPVPSLATFGLEFRLCRYQSVSIAMLFPLFLMRSLGLTGPSGGFLSVRFINNFSRIIGQLLTFSGLRFLLRMRQPNTLSETLRRSFDRTMATIQTVLPRRKIARPSGTRSGLINCNSGEGQPITTTGTNDASCA